MIYESELLYGIEVIYGIQERFRKNVLRILSNLAIGTAVGTL
jgi:hypothetical protein